MYFDDYNAAVERYCQKANAMAKILKPEEEKELFSKFHGKNGNLTEEESKARDAVICANLGLAIALATQFSHSREIDREDLISEANSALMTAVDKYNPDVCSGRFRSYASSIIIHALQSYCWQHNRIISVPRHELRQAYALYEATEKLTAELHREPTTAELAKECKMNEKHVKRLQQIPLDVESYDAILPNTGVTSRENEDEEMPQTLVEQLSETEEKPRHFPVNTRVTLGDSLRILRQELKKLDKFQYDTIRYRFNLDRFIGETSEEELPLSCEDICLILNCTKGTLVQTEYAVLQKLRQAIIDRFKNEFGVVRITPKLLKGLLAAESEKKRSGRF